MERKYEQIVRFVQETPWAVKPEMLLTIRGIVAAHLAGAEIEQIESKRPTAMNSQQTGAVGVLPLWGVIVPHAGLMTNMSGGVALDTWIQDFRAMVADPSVSTIVLDIDSPGGAVAMVPETAAEIRAATGKKKIVAVANTEIASAAYWLASQADEIVTPMSGGVGSIGVIAEHTDISQMEAAAGVTRTYITAGEYKAEQLGPLTDEAKAEIQRKVDQAYEMFVADVAKGRGVSPTVVRETYGKGRMLTGRDSLSAGMADRIGTLDTVLAKELPARARTRAENNTTEVVSLNPATTSGTSVTTYDLAAGTTSAQDTRLWSNNPDTFVWSDTTNDWTTLPLAEPEGMSDDKNGDPGQIPGSENPAAGIPAVGIEEAQKFAEYVRTNHGSASRGADHNTKEGTMDERMTLDQLAARRDEITSRMRELNAEAQGRRFYEEEQFEFDTLDRELHEIDDATANIREREARIALAVGTNQVVSGDGPAPPTQTQRSLSWNGNNGRRLHTNAGVRLPENIYDLTAYRGFGSTAEEINGLYREGARRVLESIPFDSTAAERRAEKLIEGRDAQFATRVLTTGSDLYDRAFGKLVMGKPLSTQEDASLKAAISNTGLGSETPVPVTIDPTVMLTSDGAINPIRELARNVTITGNRWQGISSDGVDIVYEAELTQVADTTPQFDAPSGEVAKAHVYVEFSIEIDQDWPELRSNLGLMFQDAKDMKEAEKFLFGSGTNEPEGLLTALIAEGSSIVYTATLNTFADSDLYLLKSALPPRFRSNAVWLANDEVYSAIRQFDTSGGASLWTQLGADRPPMLLGKPVYEASEMSGASDTGNEEILIYGDFQRGFIVIDRVGLNVELIPHVLGANRRPIGARALYAYFRNTSLLFTPKAFRVLTVKPT